MPFQIDLPATKKRPLYQELVPTALHLKQLGLNFSTIVPPMRRIQNLCKSSQVDRKFRVLVHNNKYTPNLDQKLPYPIYLLPAEATFIG